MGSRPLLMSYLVLLNLCASLIWWHPHIMLAAASKDTRHIAVTDEVANKESFDSIYKGTVKASWESLKLKKCGKKTFGPHEGALLTIGKHHWIDPNPFYLSIYGAEEHKFSASMISSITSLKQNHTFWSLQAAHENDGFTIVGTLTSSSDTPIKEQNALITAISQGDQKNCGGLLLRSWKHGNGTVIQGYVNPHKAEMKLRGEVRLQQKRDGPEFSYTFEFIGQWVDTSAKLVVDAGGPSWPEAGTGPPLSVKYIPIVPTSTTTRSTTKRSTTAATSTGCTNTWTSTITVTAPPAASNEPATNPSKGFRGGVVTAITVATTLALVALLVGVTFFIKWWRKQTPPISYPTLALIYSAPPAGWAPPPEKKRGETTPVGSSTGNSGDSGGANGGGYGGGGAGGLFSTADRRGIYNQIPQHDSPVPSTAYMRGAVISNNDSGYSGGSGGYHNGGGAGSYAEQSEPMLPGNSFQMQRFDR